MYDPQSNAWTNVSMTNAPSNRYMHSTVWTGSEMIVWGGYNSPNILADGGRYDPVTDTWATISAAPLSSRYNHTATWTGSRMIVFGGANSSGANNDGADYDPLSDTWAPLSTVNAPAARGGHTAVFTGADLLIWGADSNAPSGGRYNVTSGLWSPLTLPPYVDYPHYNGNKIWTGNEILMWNSGTQSGTRFRLSTGSQYPMAMTGSPSARYGDGSVWGGHDSTTSTVLNDGAAYVPALDSWAAMVTLDAPAPRQVPQLFWAADHSRLMIWGGRDASFTELVDGAMYFPTDNTWSAYPVTGAATGTGALVNYAAGNLFVWSGNTFSGNRFDVASNTWLPMNTTGGWPSIYTQNDEASIATPQGLFVWGGRKTFNNRPSCDARLYDVVLDKWVTLAHPIVDSYGDCEARTIGTHLVDLGGGRILVLGGGDWYFNNLRQYQDTPPSVYSIGADTWTQTTNSGFPTYGEAGFWTGNVMTAWDSGSPLPYLYIPR